MNQKTHPYQAPPSKRSKSANIHIRSRRYVCIRAVLVAACDESVALICWDRTGDDHDGYHGDADYRATSSSCTANAMAAFILGARSFSLLTWDTGEQFLSTD